MLTVPVRLIRDHRGGLWLTWGQTIARLPWLDSWSTARACLLGLVIEFGYLLSEWVTR